MYIILCINLYHHLHLFLVIVADVSEIQKAMPVQMTSHSANLFLNSFFKLPEMQICNIINKKNALGVLNFTIGTFLNYFTEWLPAFISDHKIYPRINLWSQNRVFLFNISKFVTISKMKGSPMLFKNNLRKKHNSNRMIFFEFDCDTLASEMYSFVYTD